MNPYHKFLDLSETETSPDHYGLLGVPRFTDDARVIHDALVSRNSQLKAWDNSKFYLEANALLDEVVAASFILEDPIKKAAYDTELRQRLGLSVPRPTVPAKSIEESRAIESPEKPDEALRPSPSARLSKTPEAIRAERDEEPMDTETDAPESNFDSLFLNLGGALIAVTLLIAVPLVMRSGRKPEPVAKPNQTVTPPGSSETLAAPESGNTGGSVTGDPPKVETTPGNVGTNPHELMTLNGHAGRVWSVAYSPDGKRLASVGDDYIVRVWDATSGRVTLALKGHTGEVHGVAFSPDGQWLASASVDQTVRVWDATTGRETLKLKGSNVTGINGLAWSVAFSPDGTRLAAAIGDFAQPGMVKVWDATSGEETLTFNGHDAQVRGVVYSPDGLRLASASVEGAIKVWDAATGQESLTLKGGPGWDKSIAFSPDGKWLASAGYMTVHVWDATSGEETLTIKGHTGPVYGVAFSPDGKRLASTGGHLDQTVRVWDATSGQETLTLKGHTNYVVTVAFSPDGKRLASSSFDQTVRVWDVDQTNAAPSAPPTEPKMTENPKPPTTLVQYTSTEGVVLRFDDAESHWYLVPRQSAVKVGEWLACLEPYEANLSFDQGSLRATLLGDSLGRVIGATDMAATGLELRRGRVIFQGSRKAAQRPIALAIVVGQDIWKLELLTPETVCAIEITPREPSGFEKLNDANWYLGTLSVRAGSARWTSSQGQALELVELSGIVIAANQGELAVKPTPISFPNWADAQKRKGAPLGLFASLFEKKFELDDPADTTMRTLTADNHSIISELAVRGLTLTDSYSAVVQALSLCKGEEGRFTARDGLHLWLPMAAEHGPLLRKELEALYSPAEAEAVYRLLWGFTREDGKDKATSLQFVGWLRHPNQTIRELAYHWVADLTKPRKWGYRATESNPGQREPAVRRIETLIEKDGALIKDE